MADLAEFKRLNFFTGFFTTARDWTDGQDYHLAKRRLHNRGLHTPGVIRGEAQELRVEAVEGAQPGRLEVRVLPGAALDGAGNDIYLGQARSIAIDPGAYTLPQLVYITINYDERPADYVENVEAKQYSGHTRTEESPRLEVTTTHPDNQTRLELARIDLQPGVTRISNPEDPANPRGNEIDRRQVVWAGSVVVAEPERLSTAMLERLILLMGRTRRDFAALAGRFPVPSAGDVRHAALTVEILGRIGRLVDERLPDVLAALAVTEQDAGQEIGAASPVVTTMPEFQAYQTAVADLRRALREGQGLDTLLNRQDAVAEAARELSEVVVEPPVASAGPDHAATTTGDEATVTLDATGSQAFGGRQIVRYGWRLSQIVVQPPVANAGTDRMLTTSTDEAVVTLDATGSQAFEGRQIVRYRWQKGV